MESKFVLSPLFVHLLIYSNAIMATIAAKGGEKKVTLKGWGREAVEGGREKTTGSSSAVINLGSDTGLRGLASAVPHKWVTHRRRPTQANMW